jgi:hypothetical protein
MIKLQWLWAITIWLWSYGGSKPRAKHKMLRRWHMHQQIFLQSTTEIDGRLSIRLPPCSKYRYLLRSPKFHRRSSAITPMRERESLRRRHARAPRCREKIWCTRGGRRSRRRRCTGGGAKGEQALPLLGGGLLHLIVLIAVHLSRCPHRQGRGVAASSTTAARALSGGDGSFLHTEFQARCQRASLCSSKLHVGEPPTVVGEEEERRPTPSLHLGIAPGPSLCISVGEEEERCPFPSLSPVVGEEEEEPLLGVGEGGHRGESPDGVHYRGRGGALRGSLWEFCVVGMEHRLEPGLLRWPPKSLYTSERVKWVSKKWSFRRR